MAIENGGPAFPVSSERYLDSKFPRDGSYSPDGMTLRDYFAAKAPPAPKWWLEWAEGNQLDDDATVYAQWAFSYADAMLAERAK